MPPRRKAAAVDPRPAPRRSRRATKWTITPSQRTDSEVSFDSRFDYSSAEDSSADDSSADDSVTSLQPFENNDVDRAARFHTGQHLLVTPLQPGLPFWIGKALTDAHPGKSFKVRWLQPADPSQYDRADAKQWLKFGSTDPIQEEAVLGEVRVSYSGRRPFLPREALDTCRRLASAAASPHGNAALQLRPRPDVLCPVPGCKKSFCATKVVNLCTHLWQKHHRATATPTDAPRLLAWVRDNCQLKDTEPVSLCADGHHCLFVDSNYGRFAHKSRCPAFQSQRAGVLLDVEGMRGPLLPSCADGVTITPAQVRRLDNLLFELTEGKVKRTFKAFDCGAQLKLLSGTHHNACGYLSASLQDQRDPSTGLLPDFLSAAETEERRAHLESDALAIKVELASFANIFRGQMGEMQDACGLDTPLQLAGICGLAKLKRDVTIFELRHGAQLTGSRYAYPSRAASLPPLFLLHSTISNHYNALIEVSASVCAPAPCLSSCASGGQETEPLTQQSTWESLQQEPDEETCSLILDIATAALPLHALKPVKFWPACQRDAWITTLKAFSKRIAPALASGGTAVINLVSDF